MSITDRLIDDAIIEALGPLYQRLRAQNLARNQRAVQLLKKRREREDREPTFTNYLRRN